MKRILLLLLFLFIFQTGKSAIPFRIEYAKLQILTWPIPIAQLNFKPFDPNNTQPHSKDYFVFRISPLNDTSGEKKYTIYLPTEHHASVNLCKLYDSRLMPVERAGNDHHNANTPWGYPRFSVNGGEKAYFMVTSFKKGIYFPVQFMTDAEFRRFEVKGNFGLGMFYGVAAIIFIFNGLLFIFFRDSVFVYYALFQAFIVMSIASSDGLLTFITDSPYLLNYSDLPLHIGVFVTGFLFAKHFIKSPGIFNRMQFIVIIAAIFSISAGVFYIQSGEIFFYLFAESVSLIMLCSYWVIALFQFKKNKNARLYVYAYSLYLFFALEYYIFRQIGFSGIQLFSGQLKLSCIAEMSVFLIAMMSHAGMVIQENHFFRKKIENHISEESDKQKLDLHIIKIKYNLTEREAEVLSCMTQGLSNPEIAAKLFISTNTVKYHIRNIFLKMEINSRSEAISKIQINK